MADQLSGNLPDNSDAELSQALLGVELAGKQQEATKEENADAEKASEQKTEAAPEQKLEETQKENKENDKEHIRKAENAHRQVVDMLEDKFADLDAGKLTESELKEWFKNHPEIAETADRSKRMLEGGVELKSKYRSLMAKAAKDSAVSKKSVSSREVDDSNESEEQDDEDRPLTRKEFLQALEERETRILEKSMQVQRDSAIKEFAVGKNLKDESYTRFKKTVDALYRANEDWSVEEAMQAAYTALNPSKNASVNIKGTTIKTDLNASEDNEEITGQYQPIISMDTFVRR